MPALLTCTLCDAPGEPLYTALHDRHFPVAGQWDLLRCPACELTWLNPQPTPEELPGFYASYYTHATSAATEGRAGRLLRLCLPAVVHHHDLPMGGGERLAARVLSCSGLWRDLAAPLVMWLQGPGEGRRLLDVGCGAGEFLARMRVLGYETVGVEPDERAAQVAREQRGLEVVTGSLDSAPCGPGGFAAVTANHVLEHTLDPLAALRRCLSLLQPGGVLVITVPNTSSLGCRRFGQAWLHWDPPRHLWGFSPRALGLLATRAGCEHYRLTTAANLARMTYLASTALRRDGRLPGLRIPSSRSALAAACRFWLQEYHASRRTLCGETLALIVEK